MKVSEVRGYHNVSLSGQGKGIIVHSTRYPSVLVCFSVSPISVAGVILTDLG